MYSARHGGAQISASLDVSQLSTVSLTHALGAGLGAAQRHQGIFWAGLLRGGWCLAQWDLLGLASLDLWYRLAAPSPAGGGLGSQAVCPAAGTLFLSGR